MPGYLSGPGQLLPLPVLYPANLLPAGELFPATGGNGFSLAAGEAVPVPRGRFWVNLGAYAVLQFFDPITTTWRSLSSSRNDPQLVESDGFNFRIANLTGCPVAGLVTNGGSSYVAGGVTVTASAGGSLWAGVVGGRVSTTVSITAAGAGYGVAPLVFFPPPPAPGVVATGVAVISSGTVSSITVVNQGAGYTTAPVPQILPNPADPNFIAGSITSNAAATTTLVGAGTLSAVLCTNSGAPFTVVPSLTIAGAGGSGAATIVPMWTITSVSITSGGVGYTTAGKITTIGGVPSATAAFVNPATELTGYIPRPAEIGIAAVSATAGTITTIGTVFDGGLFAGTPTAFVVGGAATTPATIAVTLGSANAGVIMQQAG